MPSNKRMSLRLDDEFSDRLEKVAANIGVDAAVIGKACLEALVKHVEEHGSITLPVEIHSAKKAAPELVRSGSRSTRIYPEQQEILEPPDLALAAEPSSDPAQSEYVATKSERTGSAKNAHKRSVKPQRPSRE